MTSNCCKFRRSHSAHAHVRSSRSQPQRLRGAMANARVPVTDPIRKEHRKVKLWMRESIWAANNSDDGLMDCPCRLYHTAPKKRYSFTTVAEHLDTNRRHESKWGSSQGYEGNESDDEWDEQVLRTEGLIAALRRQQRSEQRY